jgi:hypothetical protein
VEFATAIFKQAEVVVAYIIEGNALFVFQTPASQYVRLT